MDNRYGDNLRSANRTFEQAKKASGLLEEILGPSASQVTAEWNLSEDVDGRTLVRLRISDWTGNASTEFAPSELDLQSALRVRLYHLWGGLLQTRSEKQLQQLLGTGA